MRQTGLRGVGVPSHLTKEMRHLHPQEAGLLNGLHPRHILPAEPRTALCLVGQMTSPLQALWVHAQVWDWAAEVFSGPAGQPFLSLGLFQTQLLEARQDNWVTPEILSGGELRIDTATGMQQFLVTGPTTVGELLQAQRESLAPGLKLQLKQTERLLPNSALLHPQPTGPTYQLVEVAKRARREVEPLPPTTPSTPQREMPEPRILFGTPTSPAAPCGSTSASAAPTLVQENQAPLVKEPLLADHLKPAGTRACSDVALWCGLRDMAQRSAASVQVLPPKVAAALLELSTDCLGPLLPSQALTFPAGQLVLAPFVSGGHWTLLALSSTSEGMSGEVFDGIPGRNIASARHLAQILCCLANRKLEVVTETSIWLQKDTHSCGAIALAHAAFRVLGMAGSDALVPAQRFIADFPPLPFSLVGHGSLSSEQEQSLLKLLISKGVPQAIASSRLQLAIAKIGAGPLAEALTSKNPWQMLKAAGSKPGVSFKWVQPDELQAHVEKRAQERFGTDIPRAREKKQRTGKRVQQAPLHIDPQMLQLAPGSFVSKTGSPLGQLSYQEVKAQATGICFVSLAQAAPFLSELRNLSVDALALVTTAEVAPEAAGMARVSSLRFPVIFSPTQEAILISGSLVQLGDEEVHLAAKDIAEVDHLDTVVCRISLYRDECKVAWEQVISAPIRFLLQSVPEFQVCKNAACDQSCAAFHAAVDEVVDHLFLDVWARQWCRLSGGRTKAGEAELFQAFVRVPSSALPHLFRVAFAGLYIEPRAADGSGPHGSWAVVWLPGSTAAQALHLLKTTAKAVALTRLGTKYGLRTKEADEQAVFETLRPQHQFVKVRIVARYRLHPLPHGFQRHNLVQLLKQWDWNCKPLQPDRGDATGCAWLVGASGEPPAPAMPLGQGYVLATKVKDVGAQRSQAASVCASVRTKKALILDDDHEEVEIDPWSGGRDPWAAARLNTSVAPASSSMTPSSTVVTQLSQLETDLKQNLQTMLQQTLDAREAAGPPPGLSEQDKRLHSLESTVQELRHQGTKFESWFQSFGTKVADQGKQLAALQSTVQEQQVELGRVRTDVQQTVQTAVGTLQSELTNQMAAQLAGQEQIQALFTEKKARH